MPEALTQIFLFLCAACICVPLAGRFRLGSVLGYLAAGVLMGPYGFGFIGNAEQIRHFAEFGVVMMLFIVGLELEPEKLWNMRRRFVSLGGWQMTITAGALMLLGLILGFSWEVSLICGLALALSSTALVLQILKERGLMNTASGQSAFMILLFQDVAVIPILVLIPLLAPSAIVVPQESTPWIEMMPAWLRAEIVLGTIIAIVFSGRVLSRRLFNYMAQTNLREVFLATSLALITGITILMHEIGLSPALGAFIAGLVLASSEYRHTLEADLEPFKALLLGLFFMSVGMGADFAICALYPFAIAGGVIALVSIKLFILIMLARRYGMSKPDTLTFAFILAQGGEFAFVLVEYASSYQIFSREQSAFLTLSVAISMAVTPFLMLLATRVLLPKLLKKEDVREPDTITDERPVIIAGYGRFGQILGRFLHAQGVPITVLEIDPEQIDLLRKFGSQGYYGDASRLDMLHQAGAYQARMLIIAVDNADKALSICRMARENFPDLKIYARARNRRHAYELHKAGANYYARETFESSLRMAVDAMEEMGFNREEMEYKADLFRTHDEGVLQKSFDFFENQPELISFSRAANNELERILRSDERAEKTKSVPKKYRA